MDKEAAEKAAAECKSPLKTREVKHLLLDYPHAGRVFGKYGIDFCCGGNDILEQACIVKGIDVGQLIAELEDNKFANEEGSNAGIGDFRTLPFDVAAKKIIAKHHAYLREELPLLNPLAEKVARVHGGRHPELIELRDELRRFSDSMMDHLKEEEEQLFKDLIAGTLSSDNASVHKTILALTDEHMEHGASLATMRRLTNDYTPPPDGCNSYRSLFSRLKELENDTHTHVSLENNFLFPRLLDHFKAE